MNKYGRYKTVRIDPDLSLEEKLSIVKYTIGTLINELPRLRQFKRYPEAPSDRRIIPELDEMKITVHDTGDSLIVKVSYNGEVEEADNDAGRV